MLRKILSKSLTDLSSEEIFTTICELAQTKNKKDLSLFLKNIQMEPNKKSTDSFLNLKHNGQTPIAFLIAEDHTEAVLFLIDYYTYWGQIDVVNIAITTGKEELVLGLFSANKDLFESFVVHENIIETAIENNNFLFALKLIDISLPLVESDWENSWKDLRKNASLAGLGKKTCKISPDFIYELCKRDISIDDIVKAVAKNGNINLTIELVQDGAKLENAIAGAGEGGHGDLIFELIDKNPLFIFDHPSLINIAFKAAWREKQYGLINRLVEQYGIIQGLYSLVSTPYCPVPYLDEDSRDNRLQAVLYEAAHIDHSELREVYVNKYVNKSFFFKNDEKKELFLKKAAKLNSFIHPVPGIPPLDLDLALKYLEMEMKPLEEGFSEENYKYWLYRRGYDYFSFILFKYCNISFLPEDVYKNILSFIEKPLTTNTHKFFQIAKKQEEEENPRKQQNCIIL